MIIRVIGSLWYGLCLLSCAEAQLPADSLRLQYSLVTQAVEMQVDPLGSIYLIEADRRSLAKYSAQGQLLFRYSNNRLGDIGWLDTSDPVHIQVYYPEYRRLLILDNDLSELENYDLFALDLYDHPAVGLSYDNNFWLFDNNSGQVKKIDKYGKVLLESDNIFYALAETPRPKRLIETRNFILLQDESQGIFVFDLFGKYLKKLSINTPMDIQWYQGQLIYLQEGQLQIYRIKDGRTQNLPLTVRDQVKQARIAADQLYLLSPGELRIYKL